MIWYFGARNWSSKWQKHPWRRPNTDSLACMCQCRIVSRSKDVFVNYVHRTHVCRESRESRARRGRAVMWRRQVAQVCHVSPAWQVCQKVWKRKVNQKELSDISWDFKRHFEVALFRKKKKPRWNKITWSFQFGPWGVSSQSQNRREKTIVFAPIRRKLFYFAKLDSLDISLVVSTLHYIF